MVTLVFADIEGSPRLLEDLGMQGYRETLAEQHRGIVHERVADMWAHTYVSILKAMYAGWGFPPKFELC